MVDEDVGGILKGGLRGDGTVGDDLQEEFLVVGLLLDAEVLHRPVHLLDRGVDGVHGNRADRRVLVTHLLGRDEAAALGDREGDFQFDGGLQGADVKLGVQHLERRQSLGDVLGGKFGLTADRDARRLGVHGVHHPAEADLLQVQDDVLHAFDHAGDGLELFLDPADLDLRDGETFQRGEEDAAEGVADGLSVARLKRPELETADGLGAFEHDHLVGFLKC